MTAHWKSYRNEDFWTVLFPDGPSKPVGFIKIFFFSFVSTIMSLLLLCITGIIYFLILNLILDQNFEVVMLRFPEKETYRNSQD